jgi:hypothetical protein
VIQNILAGPDVPTGVAIEEKPVPSITARDEQPEEERDEQEIGQRRDEPSAERTRGGDTEGFRA